MSRAPRTEEDRFELRLALDSVRLAVAMQAEATDASKLAFAVEQATVGRRLLDSFIAIHNHAAAQRDPDRNRLGGQARYRARRLAGKCVKCGAVAADGVVRCAACHERMLARKRKP